MKEESKEGALEIKVQGAQKPKRSENPIYAANNRILARRHGYIEGMCKVWVKMQHPDIYELFYAEAEKKYPTPPGNVKRNRIEGVVYRLVNAESR